MRADQGWKDAHNGILSHIYGSLGNCALCHNKTVCRMDCNSLCYEGLCIISADSFRILSGSGNTNVWLLDAAELYGYTANFSPGVNVCVFTRKKPDDKRTSF